MSVKKNGTKKIDSTVYLGGLASMGAACICHPLDTVKVHLQTQQKVKFGVIGMTRNMILNSGFLSLYNGLSAALLRQGTYSTARFAFYEIAKDFIQEKNTKKGVSFYQKVIIAGLGGGIGSLFGSPCDLITVRMQNDTKLEPKLRRNYKNCFNALYRISKYEGFLQLYTGFHMATIRGILVTIGQLAFYDEFKTNLIKTTYFKDNLLTHFTASMAAGLIATAITQPADVLKTLLMNAKPGELTGIVNTVRHVVKYDKLGLFKGFTARYIRLGPFTILTFVFYEKLKSLVYYFNKKELQ